MLEAAAVLRKTSYLDMLACCKKVPCTCGVFDVVVAEGTMLLCQGQSVMFSLVMLSIWLVVFIASIMVSGVPCSCGVAQILDLGLRGAEKYRPVLICAWNAPS